MENNNMKFMNFIKFLAEVVEMLYAMFNLTTVHLSV